MVIYTRTCIKEGKLIFKETVETTAIKLQSLYGHSDIHKLINEWNRKGILQFTMEPFQPRLLWVYYV